MNTQVTWNTATRPLGSYGPHIEADRIDHCGACGAESPPQVEDRCPVCNQPGNLISTWGEFQHERYRTGERYDNNGPQEWEDGPQPAPPAQAAEGVADLQEPGL